MEYGYVFHTININRFLFIEFHWSYESDGTGPESWGIGYEV